jgi:hypothetical protein
MPLWGYNVVKEVVHMLRENKIEISDHTGKFSVFVKTLSKKASDPKDENLDLSDFKDWIYKEFGDPDKPDTQLNLENFLAKLTPKEKKFWYIVQVEFLYDEFFLKKSGINEAKKISLDANRNQLIKILNSIHEDEGVQNQILNQANFKDLLDNDIQSHMQGLPEDDTKIFMKHLNLNEIAYNEADRTKKGTMILNGLVCGIIIAIVAWYFLANYVGIAKGMYGLMRTLPSIKELASTTFYLELLQKFFINTFSFVLNIVPSMAGIEGVSRLPSDVMWSLASLIPLFKVFSATSGPLTQYPGEGAFEAFQKHYEQYTGVDVFGKCLGDAVQKHNPKNSI